MTAGRRLARTLRCAFSAHAGLAGDRVWPTPEILPWNAWIHTLWESALYAGAPLPARLDRDQELVLWEDVLAEHPETDQLLDLPAAAEAARDAWELMHAWRLDRRAVEAAAGDDTRVFLDWARRFEHISEIKAWLEPARQLDHLAAGLRLLALPASVVLAGFDEFTPQQRDFLAACERVGIRLEIAEPAGSPGRAVRVAFPDRTREFEAAARWARALIEQGQARSVGVIVPDLEAVRSEVERIFARILDPPRFLPGPASPSRAFNVAAPPPLIAQPLIRSALLALQLDRYRNPLGLVSSLLRSTFFAGADSERSARARLDAGLRERGVAEISVMGLRRACRRADPPCPLWRKALRRWSQLDSQLPERRLPGLWSRDFTLLLEALGWPGERSLSSQEHQARRTWNEVLDRLARLDAVSREITRRQAVALLGRLLARTPHQPESEPAPIQVLGVLEAAGQQFDALWIAGLNDESWPRPPQPTPFLPLALQRARRLPHSSPERELEFARKLMRRLLLTAPHIVASWSERVEDRRLAPSPLIRDWPLAEPNHLILCHSPTLVRLLSEASRTESLRDWRAPAVPQQTWSRGGTRVFQYQALCPFRAFAELRLGALPIRFPQPGLSPTDRGHAAHAALEHFWRNVESQQKLLALDPGELDSLLAAAVEHALNAIRTRRDDLPARLVELERLRLHRLLACWIQIEKRRTVPFRVIAREDCRQVELAGVSATIKIDRVDRLDDGREMVLDYKTGECSISDWQGDRPSDPQLPVYALSHQGPLGGLAFAQIKTGKIRFRGLASDPLPAPDLSSCDLSSQLRQWRLVLEQLAAHFREGRAEVDPKQGPRTCRICHLAPLCRIHQARLDAEDLEEESL